MILCVISVDRQHLSLDLNYFFSFFQTIPNYTRIKKQAIRDREKKNNVHVLVPC